MPLNPSNETSSDADASSDEAVIIALGSNLAGAYKTSESLLEAALARLADEALTVRRRSRWRRTRAWPDPSQPEYLNGVAIVETALGARETLDALLRVERAFGRRRDPATPRNAARTLDLDLIAHGRRLLDEPGLILPHPRAHQRGFVMGPLAEIAPAWRHPVSGETAAALAARAAELREPC